MQEGFKKSDIEILVSTMNRGNLDFLIPMFPFVHFSQFSILVINQTTKDSILQSPYTSVRIINAFEKGLSKSRNMALSNASGRLILLTDDDVVFTKDFADIITEGFNNKKEAAAIQFRISGTDDVIFKRYPKKPGELSYLKILAAMSIELVYNREIVLQQQVKFDEDFGLGAEFPLGEEHIFLSDLKEKGLDIFYDNGIIAKHSPEKNSDAINNDKRYQIIGAYYTRMFPKTFYFWLPVFFFFNLKSGRMRLHQLYHSYSNIMKGRNKYMKMT